MSELTAERLRHLLSYDPATGAFKWRVDRNSKCLAESVAGGVNPKGYVAVRVDYRPYRAHRLAWLYVTGEWPEGLIDHINGEPADNRFCNLRVADSNTNAMNRRRSARNTSGFKGVSFHRAKGMWRAEIAARGARYTIGLFNTVEEAAAAYRAAAVKHHGEFARAA